MDTDSKLVRKLKGTTKRIRERACCQRYGELVSADRGCARLAEAIRQGGPFLAGRLGSNECKISSRFLRGQAYSSEEIERIVQHAGVFPAEKIAIDRFAEVFLESIREIDLLGVWYPRGEGRLIESRGSDSLELTPLRALEPYYFDSPWSQALEGRRVLVVHPFAKTIAAQYANRRAIYPDGSLPDFSSLETLPAVQTIAGESADFANWDEARRKMEDTIEKKSFDVALIGAGAYGLPLGACVKRLGRCAIHMGGATQILFGIKGRRWDRHPVIARLYNDAWVRPLPEETPERKEVVEGGSYW